MRKIVFLAIIAMFLVLGAKAQPFYQMNAGQVDQFSSIAHCGNHLFMGTYKQILRSTDNGANWQPVLNIVFNGYIYVNKIVFSGAYGLAQTTAKKLFFTNDAGTSWTELQINEALSNINDICFGPNQNEFYILATDTTGQGGFILKSNDFGTTWSKVPNCSYSSCRPISMCWKNDTAYIATNCNDVNGYQQSFITRIHNSNMLTTALSQNLMSIQTMTIVENDLIFLGTTTSIEGCIGKKNIESNMEIPISLMISPILNATTGLKVSQNYEAITVNFYGLICRISLSGTIENSPIDIIYSNPTSEFCAIDVFHSSIYAVGIASLALTNNLVISLGLENVSEYNKQNISCQNPFKDNLNLRGVETGKVTIYCLDGKKIFEGEKFSEDLIIETSNFPSGMYLLQIGGISKKIVKQ